MFAVVSAHKSIVVLAVTRSANSAPSPTRFRFKLARLPPANVPDSTIRSSFNAPSPPDIDGSYASKMKPRIRWNASFCRPEDEGAKTMEMFRLTPLTSLEDRIGARPNAFNLSRRLDSRTDSLKCSMEIDREGPTPLTASISSFVASITALRLPNSSISNLAVARPKCPIPNAVKSCTWVHEARLRSMARRI